MPTINTYYDYELNRECFEVTGDAGYVHSTDILFSETGTRDVSALTHFVATFNVNVIREIGNSKLAIYDNGNLIYQADWNATNNTSTISLDLNYNTEHNLVARYLGNDSCLPSKSISLQVYEDMPSTFASTITLYDDSVNFDKETTIRVPIGLSSDEGAVSSESVKFYIDGVLNDTKTTTADGECEGALTSVDEGLHTLQIVYEGSATTSSCTVNKTISVGYKPVLVSCSDVFVPPTSVNWTSEYSGELKIQALDYFNHPATTAVVVYTQNNTNYGSTSVDSNGIGTIINPPTSGTAYISIIKNMKQYTSNTPITICSVDNAGTPSVSASQYDVATGVGTTLSIYVHAHTAPPNKPRLPVKIDGGLYYTDSTGKLNYDYVGTGVGDKQIEVRFGNRTNLITIYDYLQVWDRIGDNEWNMNYNLSNCSLSKYPTYYKMVTEGNIGQLQLIEPLLSSSDDWVLSFDVKSSTAGSTLLCGVESVMLGYSNVQNSTITLTKEGNSYSLSVNQTVVASDTSDNGGVPSIYLSARAEMQFNNLKLKRL